RTVFNQFRDRTRTVVEPHRDTHSTTSKCFKGVVISPASSVRCQKHSVREVKTPAFDERQVRALFDSIDTSGVDGVRDQTLLMVLTYTAARVGAVARAVYARVVHTRRAPTARLACAQFISKPLCRIELRGAYSNASCLDLRRVRCSKNRKRGRPGRGS